MQNEITSKYQKKIITIPNILSLCRILMIPPLFWLYCVKGDYIMTLCILILSGLTDVVDGFIARHYNMVSDVGKVLDPIADKLTQAVMLGCLITRFKYMLIPLLILVVKEIFAAITGWLTIKKSGEVYSAVWHGKAATALLYASMAIHILWFDIPVVISNLLITLCVVMMVISAVLYGIRNIKIITNS